MTEIIINDITPRRSYTAVLNQTVFTYPFPIFSSQDLKVSLNSTLQVEDTDYTVTGVDSATGGTVIFNLSLDEGDTVVLYRETVIERLTDFQPNGDLLASDLNRELDTLTTIQQELDLNTNLTQMRFDPTVDGLPLNALTDSVEDRAGKFLSFGANGQPMLSTGTGGSDGTNADIQLWIFQDSDVKPSVPNPSTTIPNEWTNLAPAVVSQILWWSLGTQIAGQGNYTWGEVQGIAQPDTIINIYIDVADAPSTPVDSAEIPSGWSQSIPVSVMNRLFISTGTKIGGVGDFTWTDPSVAFERANRTDLIFIDSLLIPATPDDSVGVPAGWVGTSPASVTNTLYSSFGIKQNDIGNFVWQSPIELTPAQPNVQNFIFQDASSPPSVPADSPGVPSGWVDSVPASVTDTLYFSLGTQSSGIGDFTWGAIGSIGSTAGSNGATWRTGVGAPADSLGVDGDFYLRSSDESVYQKGSGTWTIIITTLKGVDGAVWHTASGVPDNSLGKDGDFYLRTDNESIYSKAAGAWTISVTTIKGGDGGSVLVIYADDAAGTNRSTTIGSRTFVLYHEYTGATPDISGVTGTWVNFVGVADSVFPIYATNASGANQSFSDVDKSFVTFYEANVRPTLPVTGQTFIRFVGTDGGDGNDSTVVGPRTANGFLYYQVPSATSPATPTASNYSFDTGSFGSATSNWSTTPPIMSPTDTNPRYWAVRFAVVEATLNGTQTTTLSSPFQATNFTGVVSFTDLSTGGSTTINGDNITTGEISVDRLSTGSATVSGGFFELGGNTSISSIDSGGHTGVIYSETNSSSTRHAVVGVSKMDSANTVAVVGAGVGSSTGVWGGSGFNSTLSTHSRSGSLGTSAAAASFGNTNGSGGSVFIQPDSGGAIVYVGTGNISLSGGSSFETANTLSGGPSNRRVTVGGTVAAVSTSTTVVNNVSNNVDISRADLAIITGGPSQFAVTDFYGTVSLNGHTLNSFTGAHLGLLPNGTTISQGDIIVDTGNIVGDSGFSDTLSIGAVSSSANQKGALGIFNENVDAVPSPLEEMYSPADGGIDMYRVKTEYQYLLDENDTVSINALGEGQMNVCNEGGDIEIGDLIVCSSIAGKGMRQSDDLVRGYTVAKARENVTFSSNTEVKLVACIYLCG